MMRRLPFLVFAAGAALALPACQTPAAADKPGSAFVAPQGRRGELIHRDSDFRFPPQVAGFHRVRHVQYEPTGQDVSVTYVSDKPGVAASVYIYPRHGLALEQEFARRRADVLKQHRGALLISAGFTPVTPQAKAAPEAEYRFRGPLAGEVQAVRSRLVVAERKDWFVEYRFSYPAGTQAACEPLVRQFEEEFAWP